ncbi:capsule assembly Wzi family protein [Parapedobacter tibetensis]|uniref:capsule assembly Wzi family protein n=1 Tax=Parapedobacter tibetensis TaxID=2972951 RepID=UPI00214D4929|nr:capsule assembly Wzi family protein [Parapedobacter tibetensis]
MQKCIRFNPAASCKMFLVLFIVGVGSLGQLRAQVLPVGTPVLEDKYRRDQLLGLVDSTVSFTIRPLSAAALQRTNVFDHDGTLESRNFFYTPDGNGYIQFMPASLQFQTNSTYPYGWNDGGMIPSQGGQVKLSAGVFAKYKFLSVQFQPEVVMASNRMYDGLGNSPGFGRHWYITFGNKIDLPEYFGRSVYTDAFLGQSSVRLNFDPVSFGVSTENLWWGPGIRNSLLMSNTAPGFPHFTINTTRPVSTPIGSFEGQLVGGRLRSSGFLPSITDESLHQEMYYIPKPKSDRYFSGFIASYQPKWLPGLSLGIIRSFVVNSHDQTDNLRDYLPFFKPVNKEARYLDDNGDLQTDGEVRDRYGSAFFRWVMPAGKFEVYGEYGRKVRPENGRDWMVQSTHSRAYVLGFRKLVSFKYFGGEEDMLQFDAEVTELSFNRTNFMRESPTWYTHHVVRDGYTHRGQVLGAGIGPGSNVQSIDMAWVRNIKQIGLRFERFVQKEDFMYREGHVNDLRRGWVDLGLAGYATWDYKNFVASAKLQYMHSYNYRFEIYFPPEHTFWGVEHRDKNNYHLQLGLSYLF